MGDLAKYLTLKNLAIVVVLGFLIGVFSYSNGQFKTNLGAIGIGTTDEVPTAGAGGAQKVIQYAGSVTQTIIVKDKYTGALIDVEGLIFRGNTNIYDEDAVNSNTVTLNKGETVKFIAYDNDQTNHYIGGAASLDSSDDWYMIKEDFTATMDSDYDSKAFLLVKEGDVSVSIQNSDGSTANASGAQEDLSAGDAKQIRMRLTGPAEASFGAAGASDGIGILFDGNTELYEKISVVGAEARGGYQCNYTSTSTSNTQWEYVLSESALENGKIVDLQVLIEVKSGIAPVDATADINYMIADPAGFYYEDAPAGASIDEQFPFDVCDRTDVNETVGANNYLGTIYIS